MSGRKISRTDLARITGIPMRKLKEMSDAGEIPGCEVKVDRGYHRYLYDLSSIRALSPHLLDGKTEVIVGYLDNSKATTYRLPRRIIQAIVPEIYRRKDVRVIYMRDAKAALSIGAGLGIREKGAMSILIDLMALHEGQGIPAEPPSYIAGMLGVGQRQWTQGIMPKLIGAQKIKRVRRGGIEVFVWHDDRFVDGPEPIIRTVDDEGRSFTVDNIKDEMPEGAGEEVAALKPAEQMAGQGDDQDPRGGAGTAGATVRPSTEPRETPVEAVAPPETETIPAVSALEVLQRAGVSVYDHPEGEFFWARSEHTDTLNKWLEVVDLNQVVDRIARAIQDGRAPTHPRMMADFEPFVLGGDDG